MADKKNGRTVITDKRELEDLEGLPGVTIELRKPADREDAENRLIFVDIKVPDALNGTRTYSTRCMIENSPVSLLPAQRRTEDGRYEDVAGYPDTLRSGPARRTIEAAIAKSLGARVELASPMLGELPDPEEAEAETTGEEV